MASTPDATFCACCLTPAPLAPANIWNRPGLPRIAFRIGTFATFRESMLDAISADPALAALATRNSDDYSITLFELRAAVCDVLAFYNERIANELFVRTATQRDSVLRLVRLIGYQLRPGLAATTLLAFGLDPGAQTRIAQRLRVMSIPGQDETPQTFETLEEIIADAALNAVPGFAPALPVNAFLKGNSSALLGAPAALNAGDDFVMFALRSIEEKTVTSRDALARGTRLSFKPPVQAENWWPGIAAAAEVTRRIRFFGYNAPDTFTFFDPNPAIPVQNRWKMLPVDTSIDPVFTAYPLDARYSDVKPGARLLIDAGLGTVPQLITAAVINTFEAHATLANLADTVTWVQLRRTIRGRPTVVCTTAGAQVVLARGGASSLFEFEPLAPAPGWRTFGDFVAATDVNAVSPAPNRIDIFMRDVSGQLATLTRTGAIWSAPVTFPGVITSAPRAVTLATGELIVFARGLDFGLWMFGILPAVVPWLPRGGLIASDPVPVSWGGSRIDVFVRGIDRGLWQMSRQAGVWSDWQPLLGKLASAPAVASTAVNRLDVVARADNGSLMHRRWDGVAWTDWLNLGGQIQGTPSIVATGSDRVDIFVRGKDDQLWQIARTGALWSPWLALGGSLTSDPDVTIAAGVVHVVARDRDGSIVRRDWSASGWSFWAHVNAGLGAIADRRRARIFVLAEEEIEFRAYDYPQTFSGGRMAMRLPPGLSASNLGGFAQLQKGRRIMIEAAGTPHSATVTNSFAASSAPGEPEDHFVVDFEPPLITPVPDPLLYGNIVLASHGETQPAETLGNSDATRSFLKFRLAKSPLTYLPSDTNIDGTAALEVRVNGELWQPVASLYSQAPTARAYTTRTTDAGEAVLTFGGMGSGARTPTGAMNIVARYRRGVGRAGRVRAKQLSMPLDRPVGLRDVSNPLPAEGGVDPETRDDARNAAPTTVRTFGRIVSLKDFEWLATSSGLVSRACVTWVWFEMQRAVHLTIAGPDGTRLSALSVDSIYKALSAARDPNQRLFLGSLVRVPLVIRARIVPDARLTIDVVLQNARQSLLDLFGFAQMPLGTAVHASHVFAALQMSQGTSAVMLDTFNLKGFATLTPKEAGIRAVTTDPVQHHVRIFPARPTPSDPTLIDRYARAGFEGSTPPPVLAAEQAFIENPAVDIELLIVAEL